jgi:hypothetical protein
VTGFSRYGRMSSTWNLMMLSYRIDRLASRWATGRRR